MTDSGIPGCPYIFLESDKLPFIDGNPAYGLQLHHPRFIELVGAPESARLSDRAPLYWLLDMRTDAPDCSAGEICRARRRCPRLRTLGTVCPPANGPR